MLAVKLEQFPARSDAVEFSHSPRLVRFTEYADILIPDNRCPTFSGVKQITIGVCTATPARKHEQGPQEVAP